MMNGWRTCLIRDVNEDLGVVPVEATDRVTSVRTREDFLNQAKNLIGSKYGLG